MILAHCRRSATSLCMIAVIALFSASGVFAQIGAITQDGRHVTLYQNGTWTYHEELSVTLTPLVPQPPPLSERLAKRAKRPPVKAKLKLISAQKNKIINEDAWRARHHFEPLGCKLPSAFSAGTCPQGAPSQLLGRSLHSAQLSQERAILSYGAAREGTSLVLLIESLSEPTHLLDMRAFLKTKVLNTSEPDELNTRSIFWVESVDDILYVSHGYNGYAADSKGKNAYLTAISLSDGEVLWNSRPLVSNARNFLVLGDLIISGYGFTAEPDFLFLIDRHSGRILHKQRLKTGPRELRYQDHQIYVRTYDTDYIFSVQGGGIPAGLIAPITAHSTMVFSPKLSPDTTQRPKSSRPLRMKSKSQ